MRIEKQSNKLIVYSRFFDARQTLECGQVFRYRDCDDGYILISKNQKCLIKTQDNITTITTDNPDYFYDYFDLDTDYKKITDYLLGFDNLKQAVQNGHGIRILRQDLFETIISFIISANNNIPRIKAIIERLCTCYGTKLDGYYSFPAPEQLKNVSITDYHNLGLGYRDRYLYKTVGAILDSDILVQLPSLSYADCIKKLMGLCGVGRKVADCIALFALHHTCCYPTDTWIIKADGKNGDTAKSIRERGMKTYQEYAGFAQQYRFYAQRESI